MSLSNELKFSDIQTISQLRNGMEQLYRNRDFHRMMGGMISRFTNTIHDMDLEHLQQIREINDIIQNRRYDVIGGTRAAKHMNSLKSKEEKIHYMKSLISGGDELSVANVTCPSMANDRLRLWFQTENYGLLLDQSINNGITMIQNIENPLLSLERIYTYCSPSTYFVLEYTDVERFTNSNEIMDAMIESSLRRLGRHVDDMSRDLSRHFVDITESSFQDDVDDIPNIISENTEPRQIKRPIKRAVKENPFNIVDLL